MKSNVKKIMRHIIAGLLLFCIGFAAGYFSDRGRNSIHKAGITADVSGYDEAAKRIESATAAIRNVTRNVREAQGEVRIGVDEAGNIGGVAYDIREGAGRALDGAGDIESGIRLIVGILDEAEKRNAEMEEDSNNGVD